MRGQTIRLASNALCAGTGLVNIPITTACPVAVPLQLMNIVLECREQMNVVLTRYITNTEISSGAWSYTYLKVEFNKRLSNGLSFTTNYTFSKSIDTNSEALSWEQVTQMQMVRIPIVAFFIAF